MKENADRTTAVWRFLMRVAMVSLLLSLVYVVCVFGQNVRTSPEVRVSRSEALVSIRSSSEIVNRGDRMQVWFSTRDNAFVTVLRIDTDGRVRMLHPERPWHNNYVQAGRERVVRSSACDSAACAFVIDDYPGIGYVFAVASKEPFDFRPYSNGDYWDYGEMANGGRVTGDPHAAVSKLMERLVSESAVPESSYDVSEYHVQQRFGYPRFLCYECHRFVRFSAWNPYGEPCPRFEIVRNESETYPSTNIYPATRVVFSGPLAAGPRFGFKEIRPTDSGSSAGAPRGVGSVPAPLGRRSSLPESVSTRLTDPEWSVPKVLDTSVGTDTTVRRAKPLLVRRKKVRPDSSARVTTRTQPTARRVPTRGPATTPANPVRRTPVTGPRGGLAGSPRTSTRQVRVRPDTSGIRNRSSSTRL